VETEERADPLDALLDHLADMPEDERREVAARLQHVLDGSGSPPGPPPPLTMSGDPPQPAEAQATFYLGPSVEAVLYAPTIGTAMVTVARRPDSSDHETRRRQDRWLVAVILAAAAYTGPVETARPLPEAVRDLLAQAIGLLLFGYPRQ
jgi:hypothetical protein